MSRPERPLEERFWEKVIKTTNRNDCWLWKGSLFKNGYGAFYFKGRMVKAHRIAYLITDQSDKVPDVVMHSCHVRNCVNPRHLIAGNQSQNIKMAIERGTHKTPLIKGHTLTQDFYEEVSALGLKKLYQRKNIKKES